VDGARAPDLKPCEACGHHHGSVGAHIECLNGHIRFLRERVKDMRDTFASEGYNVAAMGFGE
jgi:hypothetical protein